MAKMTKNTPKSPNIIRKLPQTEKNVLELKNYEK
jgi:hypothetical protein